MKEINNNANVKCSRTTIISTNIEKVWSVLTNINNWKSWNAEISKASLNGELKTGATFNWKSGGTKIHSTVHTFEPFKNIGWSGKALGTVAIHNWKLSETDGQTKVYVEESMEGLLPKLFKKSFNKILERGMQKWLDSLKQASEK